MISVVGLFEAVVRLPVVVGFGGVVGFCVVVGTSGVVSVQNGLGYT